MAIRTLKVTPIYYSHRNAVEEGFKGTMMDWELVQEEFYKTNKLKDPAKIRAALLRLIQTNTL